MVSKLPESEDIMLASHAYQINCDNTMLCKFLVCVCMCVCVCVCVCVWLRVLKMRQGLTANCRTSV